MSDNSTHLTGNITRDPELRYTSTGRAVANMAVAVNRRYQTNGEWHEQTGFFDVVAWGPLGENAAGSLHKGDRVVITGRLDQRHWETDNGDKRTKVELVATDIGASVRHAHIDITKTTRNTADSDHDTGEPEPEEAF